MGMDRLGRNGTLELGRRQISGNIIADTNQQFFTVDVRVRQVWNWREKQKLVGKGLLTQGITVSGDILSIWTVATVIVSGAFGDNR